MATIEHMPIPWDDDAGRRWIAERRRRTAAGESVELAIEVGGAAVGGIGVKRRHPPGAAEVGVWVAPGARGRGIAARAVGLLCRWAFAELDVARMQATVEPWNVASQRMLARAGFTPEGRLRGYAAYGGERRDVLLYSLLPADVADAR